jgi:hypothetical protein
VLVAARRHKGAFERTERVALAAHQLGQHLGDVLRVARRDRDVMDHCEALLLLSRQHQSRRDRP